MNALAQIHEGFVWDRPGIGDKYGDVLQKRADGSLPEMQSSISAAKRMAALVQDGDSILDVGCGVGHYLVSLRKHVPAKFSYTGVDGSADYVSRAQKLFPDVTFKNGDIFNLPFPDKSFDFVMCNNVLLHLPSIEQPIKELMRVSRWGALIRTLVGSSTFVIRECRSDALDQNGQPSDFNFFNIYSAGRVFAAAGNAQVEIDPDTDFAADRINADVPAYGIEHNLTKVVNGMQVRDYIIQPWCFVTIKHPG